MASRKKESTASKECTPWGQLASETIRYVLIRGRVRQETFREHLREVSGSGMNSLPNQLDRGTASMATLLDAWTFTNTTLPRTWDIAMAVAEYLFAQEEPHRAVAAVDSPEWPSGWSRFTSESDDYDWHAANGGMFVEESRPSLFYELWAFAVMRVEMERGGLGYEELARRLVPVGGRTHLSPERLRSKFHSGKFQLSLALECLWALKSRSLDWFIEPHHYEKTASEHRRLSQPVSSEN